MSDKISIDQGHGATNTVNEIDYYVLISETCTQIYDILKSHCGPYATDALIITDNDRNMKEKHYAKFTKDGINIVNSIEFISPIQRHIQGLIASIGSKVDSLSHDGTTTSMMLFSKLVKLYFNQFIFDYKRSKETDRRKIKLQIKEDLVYLKDKLEKDVITIDRFSDDFGIDKKDAIRFIAYHQAMLSSKNDLELSLAISEVVETLPKELYGLFSVSQSGIEGDKRFTVIKDDFNYMLAVHGNIEYNNWNMGTEYFSEKCDIIVSEDGLVPGNPALEVIVEFVRKFREESFPTVLKTQIADIKYGGFFCANDEESLTIENLKLGEFIKLSNQDNVLENGTWIYNGPGVPFTRPEKKKPLILIAKTIDSNIFTQIDQINKRGINKIIPFTMSVPNPYSSKSTILEALLNTAGKYTLLDYISDPTKDYLIKDAKVHYKNRRLYISNLYEKDGSQYHPFYNNPGSFEPYDLNVKAVKEYLDNVSSGRLRFESSADQARYIEYIDIYRRMICAEVRHLQISGKTYDVLADQDVLQDAFGAVLSSLEHGFVFDGYLKLNTYVSHFQDSIIKNALFSILEATHRVTPTTLATMIFDSKNLRYTFYPVDQQLFDLTDVISFEKIKNNDFTLQDSMGTEVTMVIQPADTYRELFLRLNDLLPKIVNTVRAIIPGTINKETGDNK